ncbi:MAG: hypothetical protein BWY76_01335 [bacterium ADurb.Bin429]|nr:MAG: hypothetical protein BWY76_01335 [bacterium ADurb.Bin429]
MRPVPTWRMAIKGGAGAASSLGTHCCSTGSWRTSLMPATVAAPRTTTCHSLLRSKDIGGSTELLLWCETSVSTPRTLALTGAVTSVLQECVTPMISWYRFFGLLSCKTSQRGRAPSLSSHLFVIVQFEVAQTSACRCACSGAQTKMPPPFARNASTALRSASVMVPTTATWYLPVASISTSLPAGAASTSMPIATSGCAT